MALVAVSYTAYQSYTNYVRTDRVSVFGGEYDLWGAEEMLLESLLDPDFNIVFDADVGAGVLRVDDIKVEVFYTLPGTGSETQVDETYPTYKGSSLMDGAIGRNALGERIFVIVGVQGLIKISPDGIDWFDVDSGVAETLRAISSSDSGFVAVGDNGVIISSPDGETWTRQYSTNKEPLFSVDYNRETGSYIAVGRNGVVMTSTVNAWSKQR